MLLLARGIVAGYRGYHSQQEQLLKQAVELCPEESPRRRLILFRYAVFLASRGTLEDSTQLLHPEPPNAVTLELTELTLVNFINAVENGRTAEAEDLHSDVEKDKATATKGIPGLKQLFRHQVSALRLLTDKDGRIEDMAVDVQDLPSQMLWTIVSRCLAERLTDDALYWARLAESKNADTVTGQGLASCSLIRAELSAGNGEAARRLLDLRQSRGNTHFLDDFFYARVELLAGNTEIATEHFTQSITAAGHYGAQKRFDYELNIACEIRPGQLMHLTRSFNPPVAPPSAPAAPIRVLPKMTRVGIERLIGPSRETAEIRKITKRFASLDVPVFVTGDTGTGKELVAHALHEAGSRRDSAFIPINCGAIVDTLLESELFGHQQGAFTGAARDHVGFFEEAGDGTIFLDEIGDISARLQVALLRVLESGEIRPIGSSKTKTIKCRIVAATNADLDKRVQSGEFRRDLLFRLRRLEIHIPMLRDRRTDILPLAQHFLDLGRQPNVHAALSDDLQTALRKYDWPGNIRELRNVIEQMRLLHSDKLAYVLEDLDPKFQKFLSTVRRSSKQRSSQGARPRETGVHQRRPSMVINRHPQSDSFLPTTDAVTEVIGRNRTALRRIERIQQLFLEHKTFTRAEIIQLLHISPNTGTRDLKQLCEQGFIEKIMPTASSRSHYFQLVQR